MLLFSQTEQCSRQANIKLMHDFILKILSGPMFGVDVALPGDSVHLFFCDDETMEKNNSDAVYKYSVNSLLIPCAHGSNEKILLRLRQQDPITEEEASTFSVTAQRLTQHSTEEAVSGDVDETPADPAQNTQHNGNDIIHIPLNQPVTIGQAVIALKRATEEWSESVVQYNYSQVTPDERNSPGPNAPLAAAQTPPSSIVKWAILGILGLGCVGLLFSLFMPSKIVTLQEALSPVNPEVSQNKNGKIYVLAKNQQEATWAAMALRKSNLSASNIVILAKPIELARMKQLLSENVIPFFDVRFTSAFTLDLMLSQERTAGNIHINQKLQKLLTENFPYLAAVNIQKIADQVVLTNASERLKSLGLYSQKDIAPNHVTFNVSGEVDDFQLNTLRRQVSEFYDQYGDQYVKFVVNLNEDPLRNRTFKTGADSYVVVPGNHWLYSDITATNLNN